MTNRNLNSSAFDFDTATLQSTSASSYSIAKANIASAESTSNTALFKDKPKIRFTNDDKSLLSNISAVFYEGKWTQRYGGFTFDIMPNITNVRVEESTSNKDKQTKTQIVFVDFTDETTEKAILHPDDEFSLEQGISICITKKLLSMKTCGNGHSAYNKIINRGVAVYKRSVAMAEKAAKNQKAEEERIARLNAKIARKKAKRAAKKREYEIELRKEAYVRAMKEINGNGEDSAS